MCLPWPISINYSYMINPRELFLLPGQNNNFMNYIVFIYLCRGPWYPERFHRETPNSLLILQIVKPLWQLPPSRTKDLPNEHQHFPSRQLVKDILGDFRATFPPPLARNSLSMPFSHFPYLGATKGTWGSLQSF